MNEEQINQLLQIIGKFFKDNDGNKLNGWLAISLINEVKHYIEEEKNE